MSSSRASRFRMGAHRSAAVLTSLLGLVATSAFAQSTWVPTGSGTFSWQTGANWSTDPTVPGGVDANAQLTNNITADQTVQLNAAVTLGTLGIGDAVGTSAFTLAAGSGGALTFDVTTGSASISKTTGGSDTISAGITLADALSITVSTGDLTLSGNIGNSVSSTVTKFGAGRLVLSGSNTYTGVTTVRSGTLDLTGGQIANTLNNNKALNLASTAGDVATMNVSSGSIAFGTSAGLMIGERGTGTFNQTGGTITVAGVILGDNTGANSQGTANLSGGSFTATSTVIVANRTTGTFNVSGSADVTLPVLQFGSSFGGNSATVNLDGGTLRVNQVSRVAGTGRFSFNGGTLVARVSSGTFFTGTMTAEVKSGGAIIDTGANAVTIGPALVEAAGSPGGGLTKFGTGSLTLSGSNTYTGTTTIAGGSLILGAGASLNGTVGTALSFTGNGRFTDTPADGVTQGMGTLTFAAGNGDVESVWAGSGTSTLAFSALASRGANATGNFITTGGSVGTTNRISLAGQAAGYIDQRLFSSGSAFAWYDAGGFVRGLAYDGVEGTTSAGGASISGTHVQVTGAVTAQTTTTLTTLAFTGSTDFALAAGQTVTVNGILKSGSSTGGTISGGSGIRAASGQPLVIRTDLAADTLTLGTPVLGGASGSLIKTGAGALTMTAAGAYGGTTFIYSGTLQTPASATLSFAGGVDVAAGATLAMGAGSAVLRFTSLAGSGTVSLAAGTTGGAQPDAFVADQLVSSTFSGYLGTSFNAGAQFVKSGPATLTVTGTIQTMGTTTNIAGVGSGSYRQTAGELVLSGAGGALVRGSDQNAGGRDARLYLSNGASLTLDNSTANNNDRLPNSGNKSSGNFQLSGATFNYLGNPTVDSTETYGGGNDTSGTDFGAGQSVYSVTAGTGRKATVTSTKGFTRASGGTVLFRGTNLGDGTRSTILAGVASPPTLTGGSGTTSSTTATNVAILPWAVGDTSATGVGTSLVTYDATLGMRPLATTNYAAYAGSADTTDNVRVASSATLASSKTVNALLVDSAAGAVTVTGSGQAVTVTSGALALVGSSDITLAGGTYAFGTAEGIVHAFANTSFDGSFTGSGGVTKAGFGTLAVSTAQTYTGVTRLSGGVLKLDIATGLPGGIGATGGTSNLSFSGGVLGLTTASGDFVRGLGTGVTQVQFSGNGGFAAYGADRVVSIGGTASPTALTWNSGQFAVNTLLLGATSATHKVTFRNAIALNNAARIFEVANGSAAVDAEVSGVLSGAGISGLVKTGAGTLLLSATSTYTGETTVHAGSLLVNGRLANTSAATIYAGATLGGFGSVNAALSGAGTVSPGNSPGILSATQFDGTAGLDAIFEFTATSPTWGTASASGNDVQRLTDLTTPFVTTLGSGNRIDLLFAIAGLPGGAPVAQGTYTGGFFTDDPDDFFSSITAADFRVWVAGVYGGTQQTFEGAVYSPLSAYDSSLTVTISTVPVSATFAGGTIEGRVMQVAIVPEPAALALAGIGLAAAAWAARRRRRRTS